MKTKLFYLIIVATMLLVGLFRRRSGECFDEQAASPTPADLDCIDDDADSESVSANPRPRRATRLRKGRRWWRHTAH